MGQSTQTRRDKIVAELLERSHVTIKDLAAQTEVSEATVRRDLRALAQKQQVVTVYGGAMLPRNFETSFQARHQKNLGAKQVIGQLAADLVAPDDQVFLDSGTTCFEMAPHLRQKHGLSVVLNSARLPPELQAPGVNVIMLGGQYRPQRMDTVGPIATSALEQLRGYVAFIGADGLSIDFGPSACDIDSAHLYRLAVQNARETVLLVDHTKFHSASLFKIVEWDRIQRLVTDVRPEPAWLDFLAQYRIEVICPPQATVNETLEISSEQH